MTKVAIAAVALFGMLFAAGCGIRQLPPASALPPGAEVAITANKWFSVVKEKKLFGGCRIDVSPEKGRQDVVGVKRGWMVAWLLINTCDPAPTLVLTFEDERGNSVKSEDLFDSLTMSGNVLTGRVKDTAPFGTYKYTATIGSHRKDPEIVIFP